MREHQIVINLKTEHFEEAQRLARQAGAKSASAYLRDKLIDLLELESGQAKPDNHFSQAKQERLARLARDLTRMHRELQVYVAESWHETDPAEETEKIEATHNTRSQARLDSSATKEEPINFEAALQAIDSMDLFGGQEITETLAGSDSNLSDTLARTQAGFDQAAAFAQRFQNFQTAAESNERQEPASSSGDDLEELADRAFAISPRLGAIEDPDAGPLLEEDDPLGDLLDDTLVQKMGHRAPYRRPKSEHERKSTRKTRTSPAEADPERAQEPEYQTEPDPPENAAQEISPAPLADLENLLEPVSGVKKDSMSALEELIKQVPPEDSSPEEILESRALQESDSDKQGEMTSEDASVDEEPATASEEEEEEEDNDETSSDDQADDAASSNDEGENTIDNKSDIRHDLTSGPPPKRRKRTT